MCMSTFMSSEGTDLCRAELGQIFKPVSLLQALRPSKGKHNDRVPIPGSQTARQTVLEGVLPRSLGWVWEKIVLGIVCCGPSLAWCTSWSEVPGFVLKAWEYYRGSHKWRLCQTCWAREDIGAFFCLCRLPNTSLTAASRSNQNLSTFMMSSF